MAGVLALATIPPNATSASNNAKTTCESLANETDPQNGTYDDYYGFPLPIVEDYRFGILNDGKPIFRSPKGSGFELWENALPEHAQIIADDCRKRLKQTELGKQISVEKVRQAIQTKGTDRNAKTTMAL